MSYKKIFVLTSPFIFSLLAVHAFGVNFLYFDEWEFFPIFENFFNKNLKPEDLFAQHTESRMVIPRLLILAAGIITKWNVKFEMYIIQAIQLAVAVFLLLIAKKTIRTKTNFSFIALCFLSSMLIFSLSQWKNFVTGFQMVMYLPTLWLVIGLYCSTKNIKLFNIFFIHMACALLATFSFANGMLTWIVLLIPIILSKKITARVKGIYCLIWLALFFLIITLYFNNYTQPPGHPGLHTLIEKPVKVFNNFFLLIASPFKTSYLDLNYRLIGSFALLSTIILSLFNLKNKNAAPWIALSAYAFGTVLLIANGRTPLGEIALLSSRYNAFTIYCWISLLFLFAITIKSNSHKQILYIQRKLINLVIAFFVFLHSAVSVEAVSKLSLEEQFRRRGISAVQLQKITWHYNIGQYTTPKGSKLIKFSKKLSEWGYRPEQLLDGDILYIDKNKPVGIVENETKLNDTEDKSIVFISSSGEISLPQLENKNIVVLATVKNDDSNRRIAGYAFLEGINEQNNVFSKWQIRFSKLKSETHEFWALNTLTAEAKPIANQTLSPSFDNIKFSKNNNPYSNGNFEVVGKLLSKWSILRGWINNEDTSTVLITSECKNEKRKILLSTYASIFRPDVQKALDNNQRNTGWEVLYTNKKSNSKCPLLAWKYYPKTKTALLIGGKQKLN